MDDDVYSSLLYKSLDFFFLVLRCIFCNEQRMSFDETNRLFSSRTSPSQSMVNDQMKTLCTRGVRLGVRSLI